MPSPLALDMMKHLLVEKEGRLCSRQYELNDYTRKMFGVCAHFSRTVWQLTRL